MQRFKFFRTPALAKPENETAIGNKVNGCTVFRQPQRFVQGRQCHACSDFYPVCTCGNRCTHGQYRRQIAIIYEVVLRYPDGIVTQGLGFDGKFYRFPVALSFTAPVICMGLARDQTEAKLHGFAPTEPCLFNIAVKQVVRIMLQCQVFQLAVVIL